MDLRDKIYFLLLDQVLASIENLRYLPGLLDTGNNKT